METLNLFVITGGPGSGKTSVLSELEKMGFPCASEVARQIIQEQVRDGGEALPWANRTLYTRVMLERSIESYRSHSSKRVSSKGSASGWAPTFFDRGIPDTLGYAHLIGLRDEAAIRTACEEYRYASPGFLAPPWREIYETDDERKQDWEEAERTCAVVAETYRECGYEVVELPKLDPKERADFIVEHMAERFGIPIPRRKRA